VTCEDNLLKVWKQASVGQARENGVNGFIGTDGGRPGCRLAGLPTAAAPAQNAGVDFVRSRVVLVEKLRRNQKSLLTRKSRPAARFLNVVDV